MTAAVVRLSPLAVVLGPWPAVPGRIEANGWRVDGAQVGTELGNFRVVNVTYANDAPTQYHTLSGESLSLTANELTITRAWQAPTLAAAKTILKARLDDDATREWIACRGTKATDIETAYSNGSNAVDGANSLMNALNAYNAVTWP
jgi:hypothetical protein